MLKKQLESYLKEAKKEINNTYFTDDGGRFVGEMKGNKRLDKFNFRARQVLRMHALPNLSLAKSNFRRNPKKKLSDNGPQPRTARPLLHLRTPCLHHKSEERDRPLRRRRTPCLHQKSEDA